MDNRQIGGKAAMSGAIAIARERDLGELRVAEPVGLAWRIKNFVQHRRRSAGQVAAARMLGRVFGFVVLQPTLRGLVYRADLARLAPEQLRRLAELLAANVDVRRLPAHFGGLVLDYGVLSRRKVTTVGVNFIVDAFQNLVELENLKYHGFGTGTNAESNGDTTLQTELTTEYVSNNTRPTGTTTEGASANIYRTVATLSPDSGGTLAITEHGIFDQAANSGGTLLDRSVFSAVNLVASSDSLQITYELTCAAEA